MSIELQELASSLRVNERTLRRAWALGALRGTRVSPHRLELPVEERLYLRRHWRTLSGLRCALRTEPNVAMAVMFGSVARGDDHAESDIDLLVALRDPRLDQRVALTERLIQHADHKLEVTALDDALRRPSLMVEILHDGRVLVDRDALWPRLQDQRGSIRAQAERDRLLLAERADDAARSFALTAEKRT